MAHMFADERVSSDTIDDYSKLFLDACVRLHQSTSENVSNKKGTKNSSTTPKQKKKKSAPKQSTTAPTSNSKQSKKTFFEGTCNFMSVLNTKQVIDRYGGVKQLWEGGHGGEKYIQKRYSCM